MARPQRAEPSLPEFGLTDDEAIEPTPERMRHANDNHVTGKDGILRMEDSQVRRLYRAGRLTAAQFDSAERYHQDWYDAGLAPLGAIDYAKVRVDGSKPTDVSDRRMSAADRYNKATAAMGREKRVVELVVLLEQGLVAAGKDMGLLNEPQARAVALYALQGGLDALARQYGILRHA